MGPLPERARRAIDAYNLRRADPHALTGDDFEPSLHRARAACARLVGAEADEIALVPNTSHGINLAAGALPVEKGRRVVLPDREFPANVYPWLRLAEEEGVRVDVVPCDGRGHPDEERILAELAKGDVGVLAISAVQFVDGWLADLPRLGRACREHGAFFVVDAIQAVGCVPLDVRAAEIDVLATGGHKWLCGPFGTGFAYVRRELIPRMTPGIVGWMLPASRDLADLLDYRWELWDDARRFEVSTLPFHDYAGLAEAAGLLLEVGVEAVREHVLAIQDPLVEWLRAEGIEVASDPRTERRSGILAFRPEEPKAAFRARTRAGVSCVPREGVIRLGPHFYNTADDVMAVADALGGRGG
jgi:selenocysteine lyase/cysteine desulfurase